MFILKSDINNLFFISFRFFSNFFYKIMTNTIIGMNPLKQTKPYNIPKRLIVEAYKRVKANNGGAGVDGQTVEMFEQNLKGNLYKLWNRMSSGSYFPQSVKRVEIPKADGGIRPLGIPTISDRKNKHRHPLITR